VFYCLVGKNGKGRESLLKAIRLYPFDARYYFRFFLSLFGAETFKKAHEIRERLAA
jgi:ABC-type molybdenum transport system ATPase subunit/photorepair protein PhrA